MATFGNNIVFTDGEVTVLDDNKLAYRFTVPADCNAISKFYFHGRSATGNAPANAVIYADSGGTPDAMVAGSEVPFNLGALIPPIAQWNECDYTGAEPPVTPGADYWFTLHVGVDDVLISRAATTGGDGQGNADLFGDGASDPFGGVTALDNYDVNIYLEYTPVAGLPSAVKYQVCRQGKATGKLKL